jgi:CHASE1-domain containing sensor protein
MNNVQLVMAVIAFVSLLMTILAGAWINQRGLEKQMDSFRAEMKAEMGAMRSELQAEGQMTRSEMRAGFQSAADRNAAIESRVERIGRHFDAIFKPMLPKSGD